MSEFLIYTVMSQPGLGKSTDAARAFPRGAVVAPPGAMTPTRFALGFDMPLVWEAETLAEARVALRQIGDGGWGAFGVVLDDLTLMTRNTARILEAKYPKEGSGVFDFFNAMTREVESTNRDLHAAVKASGGLGVVTMHPRPPDDKCNGTPWFDGASWKVGPFWVKQSHGVVRALSDDKRATGFKSFYRVDPGDGRWATKDRMGVFGKNSPMSLGEHFRAYGLTLPRAEGQEWIDEWVEAVAGWLADSPSKDGAERVRLELDKQLSGVDPIVRRAIRWDAYARYEIRRNLAASYNDW